MTRPSGKIGAPALLSRLNRAQREAVTTTDGPLLVLAGAGTGKTRVITFRIVHLLHRGEPAESILAVTFTNKAAREMRERVGELLGRRPEGLTLSTFHSLGARILRAEARLLGYRSNFNVYDTADQIALLRTILRDIRGAAAAPDPKAVLFAISREKNRFRLPEDVAGEASDGWEELVALAYERYHTSLRDMNCVDFDDLILLPTLLLEREPETAGRYRSRFRYVLVDEYQDTNGAQYRFLRCLVGPRRNLCVVGDDDQSIYGFRGAEVDKILGFEKDFPGARVVKLEENYRSTAPILDLANAVIAGSLQRHSKRLRTARGGGRAVRCVSVEDEGQEADFVIAEIRARLNDGGSPGSIAILIRAATQARAFEEKLRLRRIPYRLVGGQSFFDRKEVRDVLAYWGVAVNPRDDFSLLRIVNVPRRGFGSATIRKLDELSRESRTGILDVMAMVRSGSGEFPEATRVAAGHLVDLFDRARKRLAEGDFATMARGLVEESSYAEAVTELYPDPLTRKGRWAAVEDILRSVDEWRSAAPHGDFTEFLEGLRLDQQDRSDDGEERRAVSLMTLHSAKGLEFPNVFLVGVEEDILPHKKALAEGDSAIEEERRLFYVGITRARETLTISRARRRTAYGELRERRPSRFLEEVAGRALFEEETYDPEEEATDGDVQDFLDQYRRRRGR